MFSIDRQLSFFEKTADWKENVARILFEAGIRINKTSFQPLRGGLRKICFRVESSSGNLVLCFWPDKSLSRKKIVGSLRLEDRFAGEGLPCRKWLKLGEKKISRVTISGNSFWLGVLAYLPGQVNWPPDLKQTSEMGKTLARFHLGQRGKQLLFCHLDFARSNILWNDRDRICGMIDFEEAKPACFEEDLACTLSFLENDCHGLDKEHVANVFLTGYKKAGGEFNYSRLARYVKIYKMMRRQELVKEDGAAFLAAASKRLETYKKEVTKKLLTHDLLSEFLKDHPRKRIVFTVGAYELIHWGHLDYLKKARKKGDLLILGVASDESRRRLKGEPYPLITDRTRAETMAHFPFVDAAIIVDEEDLMPFLKLIKPAIYYTVKKDWEEGVRKKEEVILVKGWGGEVIKNSYLKPVMSSSAMVEKVALMKISQALGQKEGRGPMLGFNEVRVPKLVEQDQLGRLSKELHRQGKKVVFTSLSADLFHLGHARFIMKAKSLGDSLVVGVPSNTSITALKGPGRPIVDEKARSLVLSYLKWVDFLTIFDESTVLGCLEKLKPDVFFTVKEEWNNGLSYSPEARFLKSIGAKLVRSERQAPYLSASKMIDKAAGEIVQKKLANLIESAKETPVLDADGFDPHNLGVQLAAREKGWYEQVLAEVAKRGKCVFCDLKEKYLIKESDGVVLTVALFPYIDGHLLIIPRRHVESLKELDTSEEEAVFKLARFGQQLLAKKMGVENVWFLLREGEGIKAGKTVNHLHFHLLPYDERVIKMGDTKLSQVPLDLAKKLREQ